jgi:hypothetical protein
MPKVLVKEIEGDKIVNEFPCETDEKAEKIERGLNINLNHGKYYTEIQ